MSPGRRRWSGRHLLIGLVVVASACSSSGESDVDDPESVTPDAEVVADAERALSAERTIDEYVDLNERQARLRAQEERPVPASALPPRHLDADAFPESLVDRDLIVNGGPPPDGIPPLESPPFVSVGDVDWLEPQEAVLALTVDGRAQAYPIRIVMWHEVVNTSIGDRPIAVTYCPLCGSGLAFDRRLEGELLDFGTSGSLYQANLVMYDRQTESLWTQFDGRAVVGEMVGTELPVIPMATVSWAEFATAHPDGDVLSLDTGFERPYGRNLYASYSGRTEPVPGYFSGESDPTMPAFTQVVGIEAGDGAAVIRLLDLADRRVVHLDVGGVGAVAWHVDGMSSPLSGTEVAGGEAVGSPGVFVSRIDGRSTTFEPAPSGDGFVDAATGSRWNLLGTAVEGPMTGTQLAPLHHVDTFWFSWATFRPDSTVWSS